MQPPSVGRLKEVPELRPIPAQGTQEMVFIKRPYSRRDIPADIRKYYIGNRFDSSIKMKTLQLPVFILCILLWVSNQLLELNNIFIWPLHAYLDDLLCLPLVLTFILAVQRAYFKNHRIIIPLRHTFFAVAAFSVCFELVLPLFRDVYRADVLDVLAYSAGAFLFQVLINKPKVLVLTEGKFLTTEATFLEIWHLLAKEQQ